MNFSLITLTIMAAPLAVFSLTPSVSGRVKALRLLLPIVAFVLAASYTVGFEECENSQSNIGDCWNEKITFVVLGFLLYLMGIGWCEIAWRHYYKLRSWPLMEGLRHGIVSSIIIFISLLETAIFFCFISFNSPWDLLIQ